MTPAQMDRLSISSGNVLLIVTKPSLIGDIMVQAGTIVDVVNVKCNENDIPTAGVVRPLLVDSISVAIRVTEAISIIRPVDRGLALDCLKVYDPPSA